MHKGRPLCGWDTVSAPACSHIRCTPRNEATARFNGPLPWVESPMIGCAMCFMCRRNWWRRPVRGCSSTSAQRKVSKPPKASGSS